MSFFYAIVPFIHSSYTSMHPFSLPPSVHRAGDELFFIPGFKATSNYFSPQSTARNFEIDGTNFARAYEQALHRFIEIAARSTVLTHESLLNYLKTEITVDGPQEFQTTIWSTLTDILSLPAGHYLIERFFLAGGKVRICRGDTACFNRLHKTISINPESLSFSTLTLIDRDGYIFGEKRNTLVQALVHELAHALQMHEKRSWATPYIHPLFFDFFEQEANFWQNAYEFSRTKEPIFSLFPLLFDDYLKWEQGDLPLIHLAMNRYELTFSYLDNLLQNGHSINVQNKEGQTLLHQWICLGKKEEKRWEILFSLMQRGANLFIEDSQGFTPFSLLMWRYEELAIELLQYLLFHGFIPPRSAWPALSNDWVIRNKSSDFQKYYFGLQRAALSPSLLIEGDSS